MTILKLKSLLKSLLTVVLISVMLTSCEKNTPVNELNIEGLNQKVVDEIKDIHLIPEEAFDSLPTYLPTNEASENATISSRANTTSVRCQINPVVEPFTSQGCVDVIFLTADWDPSFGSCPPSNWTWYNIQKKRGNGQFTTQFSGVLYGDYLLYDFSFLSPGQYKAALYGWNQCQGKWTLEASVAPYSTSCDD